MFKNLKVLLAAAAVVAFTASCDRKESDTVTSNVTLSEREDTKEAVDLPELITKENGAGIALPNLPTIEVTHPSGQKASIRLVALQPQSVVEKFGEQVRLSGFSCDRSSTVNQLQQEDGQTLPMYKIDCDDGNSYQLTIMNEKPFLKPWTGTLIGM